MSRVADWIVGRPPEARSVTTADGLATTPAPAATAPAAQQTLLDSVPAIAALEIAAQLWGRALAASRPEGHPLTAAQLHAAGRGLVRRGWAAWRLAVGPSGTLALYPQSAFGIVAGTAEPASWVALASDASPSRLATGRRLWGELVVCYWATADAAPWRAVPPWRSARVTFEAMRALEVAVAQESAGAVGHVWPIRGEADAFDTLAERIAGLRGGTLVVPPRRGTSAQMCQIKALACLTPAPCESGRNSPLR